MNIKLLTTCLICAATPISSGEVLFTSFIRSGDSYLAQIDTSTGIVSEIGNMGSISIEGLAWDSSSSTLYGRGLGTGLLFQIDPSDASTTTVGSPVFQNTAGLTYDPARDLLLASGNAGPSNSQLFQVDRTTGALLAIGSPGDSASTIEYLPATNSLLFSDPFPTTLGTWSPDDGTQSIIGPMVGVSGMAWSAADNALYGMSDFAGVESNLLYTIDPATGATINTITLSQTEFYAALTAIPAPGGVMVFGCVCGGVGSRRRR